MKSKMTDVRKLMDDSVFKDEMFTDQHKQHVLTRIAKKERRGNLVPRTLSVVFSLILIVSIGYLLSSVLSGMDGGSVQQGNSNTSEQSPTPDSLVPPVPKGSETEEENEIAGDGVFELSAQESEIYEKFSSDFDTSHLEGLEPISVAKLYVWAGYNQNYEVEYELLTDRDESIMWDKEYHMAIPESDRMSPEKAMEYYRNIDAGEFRSLDEYNGSVIFRHADGPEGLGGMHMLRNYDGIWQVGFMPLQ